MGPTVYRSTEGVSRTDLVTAASLIGVGLLTALLVWPAFAHAVEVWSTVVEFSYGFFVPPVTLLLIWWRRDEIRRSLGPGARAGLPLVIGTLGLYLLASRVGINALTGLAVIPLLWSLVVYLWGWRAGRVLAFPLGFLAFGLGLYRGLLQSVGFALQEVTAWGAATMGRGLGLPVQRDGLVLHSDQFRFIVAEPCSGMSSLLSLLALGALWTYAARGSLPARFAVLLSVVPIVALANSTRVTSVLLIASWFGEEAALGFFHSVSSLVVFGIALVGLLLISRMVGCRTLSTAV
jgi:exosortase